MDNYLIIGVLLLQIVNLFVPCISNFTQSITHSECMSCFKLNRNPVFNRSIKKKERPNEVPEVKTSNGTPGLCPNEVPGLCPNEVPGQRPKKITGLPAPIDENIINIINIDETKE